VSDLAMVGGGEVSRVSTVEGPKIKVILARAGVTPKAYELPLGTTLRDLLEHSGARIENQILTISSEKVGPERVLANGEIIFVVPQPKNA
jgi:NADH:ubiquinone oxidoreductase subunit F (NADH-binding)